MALGVLPELLPSVAPSVLRRLGVAQARAVEPLMAAAASRREDARRSADALLPTLTALTRCSLDHEGLGAVVRGKVRRVNLALLQANLNKIALFIWGGIHLLIAQILLTLCLNITSVSNLLCLSRAPPPHTHAHSHCPTFS